ncbi:hypothetical protein, partial [Siminovitchia fortis]|uniref:hypothetical protein n=1 Tax=Siminovitchia fortis TaxID=254758 RepID=UPI001C92D2FA
KNRGKRMSAGEKRESLRYEYEEENKVRWVRDGLNEKRSYQYEDKDNLVERIVGKGEMIKKRYEKGDGMDKM